MNHQEEIPIWGYINLQILYQIHMAQERNSIESITVSDLLEKATEHGVINKPLKEFYSPINSGTIFAFLYSLLVVPKELLWKENKDFFENFDFNKTDYFEIKKGREKVKSNYDLFKYLRHSIAHANYSVIDNKENQKTPIQLWNKDPKTGDINIVLNSDLNNLVNFAIELSKYYSKYYNDINGL